MDRSRLEHAFVLKNAVSWTGKSHLQPALHGGGLVWTLGFVRLVPRGGPGIWHCCEH